MSQLKLFTASWCGSCKVAKQIIEDKKLDVQVLDIEGDGAVEAQQLGVRGLPALSTPDEGLIATSDKVTAYLNKL